MTNEEVEMAKAIEQSLAVSKGNPNYGANYEPLNPEQRKREENTPCGLQNIGNSKVKEINHFSSLLLQLPPPILLHNSGLRH